MAQASRGRGPERSRGGPQSGGNPPEPQSGIYYTNQPQSRKQTLTPAQKKARQKRKQELLRRRRRNRRILYAILFLLVVFGAFFLIRQFTKDGDSGETTLDELDTAEDSEVENYDGPPVATIAFVGDISTSADQVSAVTKSDGTYDFSQPFTALESYISDAAYAVGDFETTITDGVSYGTEPYYNSPVQLAGALHNLGFDLMSTANTYMLSNGIDGLTSTKQYLTASKLKSVGSYLSQEERDKNGGAYIRTIHNIKFAFLSYTKGTDSVRMPEGCEYALNTLYTDYSDYWTDLRSSQIRADIQAAKDAGAEVIVALVHWGSEYGRTVSAGQTEAEELLLANGVDVIIGSHSHLVGEMGFKTVEQADGTRRQCFVAYSLGDFYTDPEKETAQSSVILNLTFARDGSGNVSITDAAYVPVYQYIYEENGKRQFQLLDVYQKLAELQRQEKLTSAQARLYNSLLGVVDDLHSYAGEELDAGPAETDSGYVRQALEEGEISTAAIKALEKQEKEESQAAVDAMAEPEDSAAEG